MKQGYLKKNFYIPPKLIFCLLNINFINLQYFLQKILISMPDEIYRNTIFISIQYLAQFGKYASFFKWSYYIAPVYLLTYIYLEIKNKRLIENNLDSSRKSMKKVEYWALGRVYRKGYVQKQTIVTGDDNAAIDRPQLHCSLVQGILTVWDFLVN